jgi:hypothetical protein
MKQRLGTLAVRWVDFLFVWRARCRRCKHRRPEFVDGACFNCTMAEIHERTWAKIMQPLALAEFDKTWARLQALCVNSPRPQAAQGVKV